LNFQKTLEKALADLKKVMEEANLTEEQKESLRSDETKLTEAEQALQQLWGGLGSVAAAALT
jgi:hypothetical protein